MKKIIAIMALAGIAAMSSGCSTLDEYAKTHPSVWSPVDAYGQGTRGGESMGAIAGVANHGHSRGMAGCCGSSGSSSGGSGGHGGGNH